MHFKNINEYANNKLSNKLNFKRLNFYMAFKIHK